MANLDSLNLVVTASTSQATQSIDALIKHLEKLGSAFDIQSVDGFAASLRNMSNAINSIKGYNLKVVHPGRQRLLQDVHSEGCRSRGQCLLPFLLGVSRHRRAGPLPAYL